MEKLGCGTICEACFCTRPEKEKKGYSGCEGCEGCNDQKNFCVCLMTDKIILTMKEV